jgi:outer membrane protein
LFRAHCTAGSLDRASPARDRARSLSPGMPRGWTGCVAAVSAWLCLAAPVAAQAPVPPVTPEAPMPPEAAVPSATSRGGLDRLAAELGQTGGLTARDAGRRAAQTSVQAEVDREKTLLAQNDRRRVIWETVPRLTVTGTVARLSPVEAAPFALGGIVIPPFPSPETTYLVNARLTVPFTDYLLRMVRALNGTDSNERATVLTERATRVTVAANAKLYYYDWVRARLARVVSEQSLEQARAQLVRVQAMQAVGQAAEADLQQALAFQADAELVLAQSGTQQIVAEERLRMALHAEPGETLRVGEDVLATFDGAEEPRQLQDLYQEADSQRLELQAINHHREAAEQLRAIEATRALPRLEGVGSFTYANPNPRVFPQQENWDSSWDVGLSMIWSVNDLGTSGTSAEVARSQRDQLSQQRRQVQEGIYLEVASAYHSLAQARLSIGTAEQGERAAVAAFRARVQLEEQGMATALELMLVQNAAVRARLNLINAHIALRVSRVQLDHALGRDAGQL